MRGRLAAGVVALLAVVAGVTAWKATRPTMEERLEKAVQRPEEQIPTVGVVPFVSHVPDLPATYGSGIADLIYTNLNQSKHLKPVSPARMADLKGQEDDRARLLNDAAKAGIRYLLTGTIFPDPQGLTVSFHLTDTRTGEDLASDSRKEASPEALFSAAEPIAVNARRAFRVPTEEQVDVFQADFAVGHPDAYNRYVTGLRYLLRYRYEEAEQAFSTALDLAPGFGMAHYRLGLVQLATGREPEGRASLERAAAGELSEREARYVRITRALWGQRYDEAESEARQLVDLYPFDVEALFLVAEALRVAGRYEEEIRHLVTLTELEPNHQVGWSMLAEAYLENGQPPEAAEAAQRILAPRPEDANARVLLGRSVLSQGAFEEAAEEFRRALELDPKNHYAKQELALAVYLDGRSEEAAAILEQVIGDPAAQPLARVLAAVDLAEMLRAAGRFSKAAEILDGLEPQFAAIEAYRADGMALRALCLLETGDLEAAAALAGRAVDNLPAGAFPTRYLFARGLVEIAEGSIDAAQSTAEEIQAGALPPEHPDRTEDRAAAYLRGMALLADGDAAAAVSELEAAADLSVHDYPYRAYGLGLARALIAADELPRALEAAEQAATPADPADPRLWLELDRARARLVQAEILAAMGEPDRARDLATSFLEAWSGADSGPSDLGTARRLALP